MKMKKFYLATLCVAFLSLCFVTNANAQSTTPVINPEARANLKPYPLTVDSLVRYVVILEPKADEDLYKVELFAGKLMEVDCNRQRLIGQFAEEDVQGWGYPYYTFESDGQVISTMMACFEPKQTKFVTGESMMIRYNSRLPIVVYLPKDLNLEYRIWSTTESVLVDEQE